MVGVEHRRRGTFSQMPMLLGAGEAKQVLRSLRSQRFKNNLCVQFEAGQTEYNGAASSGCGSSRWHNSTTQPRYWSTHVSPVLFSSRTRNLSTDIGCDHGCSCADLR